MHSFLPGNSGEGGPPEGRWKGRGTRRNINDSRRYRRRRIVIGTFHKVSDKYLALYVAEFQFRYNNRFNTDIFGTAISGC
jgi:hypothetical protein